MTEINVREKYRELINDIDFDKLELLLKTPNIFQILGVARTEIRHSNFLAWLLNPNGSHGLGKLFLTKFLRGISTSDVATELDEFEIEELNFNNVEIRREWKNIDLLLIFDSLVICIENKIDSKDHSNQLTKYREIVNSNFKSKKKVFVYLTPIGELPTDKTEREYYAPYSYQEIIEQFDRILKIHGNSLNNGVNQYILDYLTTIKRELMKNDELNELADKIYKNHRELIDFVFEHKSDIASELYPVFVKKIENSGWVMGSKHKGFARFLTSELDNIIPKKGKGWPLKENFLFEIDYFWGKKKVVFKTVVSPGAPEIHDIFKKAMSNIEGAKKPRGNKWLVHFIHTWKFDVEDFIGADESEVMKVLDKEWGKVQEIVNKVETELLKYKTELQQHLE
ncbi:PD-(D/E)XK nuclease family protein [Cellulophaga lytica]|uniref:PDDEXK-like family protein n=1 Tax=Cellulophaga lytica TaxID=979 RepID=UPI0032E45334